MDELEKLYNVVNQREMFTGSFEAFQEKFVGNPEQQNKLFEVISSRELFTKGKDEFTQKYFPAPIQTDSVKKKDDTTGLSENGELDSLPQTDFGASESQDSNNISLFNSPTNIRETREVATDNLLTRKVNSKSSPLNFSIDDLEFNLKTEEDDISKAPLVLKVKKDAQDRLFDSVIEKHNSARNNEEDVIDVDAQIEREKNGDFGFLSRVTDALKTVNNIGTGIFGAETEATKRKNEIQKERELIAESKSVEVDNVPIEEAEQSFYEKRRKELIRKKGDSRIRELNETLTSEEQDALAKKFQLDKFGLQAESSGKLIEIESLKNERDSMIEELSATRSQLQEIQQNHDSSITYPQEYFDRNKALAEQEAELVKNINEIPNKVSVLFDDFVKTEEDIQATENEIDLYKRNYNDIVNSVGKFGASATDFVVNLSEFSDKFIPSSILSRKLGDALGFDTTQRNKEQRMIIRETTEDIRGSLRRPIELDEINSSNIVDWAMDLTSEQAVNVLVLAGTGGAGTAIIGASSAGAKSYEMDEEERLSDGSVKFTTAQKIFVPLLFGIAEAASEKISLGQINKMKRVFKSQSSDLLKRNLQTYLKDNYKDYFVDTLQEGGSEALSQFSQNLVDKYFLDKDISLSEGLTESFVSGAFMSAVIFKMPALTTDLRKALTSKDSNQKLGELSDKLLVLAEELKKPNISQETRNAIINEQNSLVEQQQNILSNTVSKLDELDDSARKELLDIENERFRLRKDFDKINRDASLSKTVKKELLDKIDVQINNLELNKENILSSELSIEVNGTRTTSSNQDFENFLANDENVQKIIDGNINVNITNNKQASDLLEQRISEINNTEERQEPVSQEAQEEVSSFNETQEGENTFNPLESEGESIGRLSKSVNENKSIDDVAQEHTDSYLEYLEQQGVGENVLNSEFVNTFKERLVDALNRPNDFDFNQERSPQNGSRIDNNGELISEIDYLTQQGSLTNETTQATNTETDTNIRPDNIEDSQQGQSENIQPTIDEGTNNENNDFSGIDSIIEVAQQLTNEEVSLQDIADFIKENRSPNDVFNQQEDNVLSDLESKFQELTGLRASDSNINAVLAKSNNQDISTEDGDNSVPFQTESNQERIQGSELNKLVDRLKITGLANDVQILNDSQIADVLKDIGIENINDSVQLSSKGVTETPNGFVYNGIVYLNKSKVKKDTPIHEFGHLWNSWAKENNSNIYNRGLELIKDSEYHKQVKNNPAYNHLSEESQLEEALAQAIGEKGVKILKENKKSKFNTWFKNLFTRIAKGLGITSLNSTQLSNLNLDKFTDLVGAELLSGQQIIKTKRPQVPKNIIIEADISNIDLIISEQKSIQETKNKLNDLFRKKRDFKSDIKKILVKYIQQKIDSKRYNEKTKGEFSKILTLVKSDESTKKSLLKAMQKIDDISLDIDNRILEKSIKKILNRKFTKKESGRTKLNNITDIQGAKIFKTINDVINQISEYSKELKEVLGKERLNKQDQKDAIINLFDDNFNRISELNSKTSLTENEQTELIGRQLASNYLSALLSDNSSEKFSKFNESLNELNEIYEERKSIRKQEIEDLKKQKNEWINNSLKEINSENKPVLNNKPENVKILNFLFDIASKAVLNIETMFRIISKVSSNDKFGGFLFEISNNYSDAEISRDKNIRNNISEFEKITKSIYKNKRAFTNAMSKKFTIPKTVKNTRDDSTEIIDVILSKDEMIYLYMQYQNLKEHPSFESAGFTQETMDIIENNLSESDIQFSNWLFEFYSKKYESVNESYKKLYGIDMPKQDFYAGYLLKDSDSNDFQENLFENNNVSLGTVSNKSQKNRTGSNAPIVPIGVTSIFKRYNLEMEHTVAMTDIYTQMKTVFRDKTVRTEIEVLNPNVGKSILDSIDNFIKENIEQAGKNNNLIIKTINNLHINFVKATLYLKPKIGITQLISSVNTWSQLFNYRNSDISKGLLNLKTDLKYILDNSDYLKNRSDLRTKLNAIANVESISSDSKSIIPPKAKYYMRAMSDIIDKTGGVFIKYGDKTGILGGAIVFASAKQSFIRKGMTESEANKRALKLFERSADRTQQPLSKIRKSIAQTNPIFRLFIPFRSSPIQMLGNSVNSSIELYRKITGKKSRGTVAENVTDLVNYGFIQPTIYGTIQGGSLSVLIGLINSFFDDDELSEKEKALASNIIGGNFTSFPIAGSILQSYIDKRILGREFSFGDDFSKVPALDVLSELNDLIISGKVSKSQFAESYYDILERHENGEYKDGDLEIIDSFNRKVFEKTTESVFGIPTKQGLKLYSILTDYESHSNRYGNWGIMKLAIGYSYYSVSTNNRKTNSELNKLGLSNEEIEFIKKKNNIIKKIENEKLTEDQIKVIEETKQLGKLISQFKYDNVSQKDYDELIDILTKRHKAKIYTSSDISKRIRAFNKIVVKQNLINRKEGKEIINIIK